MAIGVTEEHLRVVRQWAAQQDLIKSVTLFGSRSRGTNREDSDVDFAIEFYEDNEERIADQVDHFGPWSKELSELVGLKVHLSPNPDSVIASALPAEGIVVYQAPR